MWFLPVAANLLMGHMAKKDAEKKEDEQRDMRRAQVKYSPYTGRQNFQQIQSAPGDAQVYGGAILNGLAQAQAADMKMPWAEDNSVSFGKAQDVGMVNNAPVGNGTHNVAPKKNWWEMNEIGNFGQQMVG